MSTGVTLRGRGVAAAVGFATIVGASLFATVSPANAAVGAFNGGGLNVAGGSADTSSIVVSGQDAAVSDVNVVINGITTNFTQVIDAVLESPSGAKVMLMSDVACSNNAAAVTVGIDDSALIPFPGAGAGVGSSALTNGTTYRPTDLDPDQTPCDTTGDDLVPVPTAATLSAFAGSTPNGTWKLHLASDSGGTSVSITSWSLTIESTNNACDGKLATIVSDAKKINGTDGNDVIVAGPKANNIKGFGGNDTICGGSGKDVIKGGAGDDRIFGEAGKDQLKGSGGIDTCIGGPAKDSFARCETAVQ